MWDLVVIAAAVIAILAFVILLNKSSAPQKQAVKKEEKGAPQKSNKKKKKSKGGIVLFDEEGEDTQKGANDDLASGGLTAQHSHGPSVVSFKSQGAGKANNKKKTQQVVESPVFSTEEELRNRRKGFVTVQKKSQPLTEEDIQRKKEKFAKQYEDTNRKTKEAKDKKESPSDAATASLLANVEKQLADYRDFTKADRIKRGLPVDEDKDGDSKKGPRARKGREDAEEDAASLSIKERLEKQKKEKAEKADRKKEIKFNVTSDIKRGSPDRQWSKQQSASDDYEVVPDDGNYPELGH
eukprot:TRINITY_DN104268_c0_g1_i1.p1 TRINITY_DN104268_c0_g1~~TRINITY_DN104268_c0_g1_i1.p1  ORF type:complete len:296 (-),score=85.32 TRINITY_DN104268_c0_g1_i1:329-1216(-)